MNEYSNYQFSETAILTYRFEQIQKIIDLHNFTLPTSFPTQPNGREIKKPRFFMFIVPANLKELSNNLWI